jgi:pectate lyase
MTILRNYIASLFCLVALTMYSVSAMAGAQGYQASSFGQCGTVTGGGNATPTLVSTASALTNALSASGSAVIIITQNIEMPYTSVKVTNKTILALPGVKLYSNEQTASTSGILYFKSGSNNVIMRNLTFEGPGAYDCDGRDNLCFDGATNIWVDHCDFVDGTDGNLDINTRSDFITISWCTFSYTDRSFIHMNTNLIGANDNPSQGIDNLNVTYANCIWGYKCDQRMPMVRFGNIHVLNCYYNCPGNSAAVNPRRDSEVLLEGCYFEKGVKNIFHERDSRAYQMKDNIFRETFKPKNKGTVTMPYKYEVIPPKILPSVLTGTGGAGRIETSQPLP